jgi:tRNA (guanine-N7-)-methyltransferase
MRLRNIRGSEQVIEDSPYVIKNATEQKGKWQQVFQNDNPIMIEIGMGKGNFITTLAKENPQNNYIGIEKYTSVLLRAVQKMETDPVENLRFICIDAKLLGEVFAFMKLVKYILIFQIHGQKIVMQEEDFLPRNF